jgi:cytochrome P450
MIELAEKPDHVPQELVYDFDIYNPIGWTKGEEPYLAWKAMQDSHPPIFWTPRQGGHWIVTRYADIKHVAESHQDFSSHENYLPRGVASPQLPMNLDPPDHTAVRRLLMPSVVPKSLKTLIDKVRHSTIGLIEDICPKGRCEFVRDFASAIPVMAFLSLMGLPPSDHALLNQLGEDITKINDPEAYAAAKAKLTDYMLHWIGVFRETPGPGAISDIINGDVDGRKLSDEEAENMCVLVLAAGLDTVKAAIVFMANVLATSPSHLRQLHEQPALIPNAVEEILRRFGSSNLARVVRHDMRYKGIDLKAADMVSVPFPLAGLDDSENTDPLTVDFARQKIRHVDFGAGPHLCIGQALARQEIIIFVEEWIRHIPEFRRVPGTSMKMMTGLAHIPLELWLEWEPSTQGIRFDRQTDRKHRSAGSAAWRNIAA